MGKKLMIDNIQEWLQLKNKADEDLGEPEMIAELFSAEQMERYGVTLALSHRLVKSSSKDLLLRKLANSETILIRAYKSLTKKNEENEGFSPAREWLLDNFYLIQEQIHTIRRHLPKGYGRSLPQIASGYPRIYDIALQNIEHGDGRWDLENLSRFVSAYQRITFLTLGELWAIPIALGVALIENLSKSAKRIVADRNDRHQADLWADRMIEVATSDPKKLVIIIADMARSEPQMSSAYVAELTRRLQSAALSLPLSWIEQHLIEEGLTSEQLIQGENKRQAANQVTISNSIAGLRHLTEVDWRDFVETMSVVEKTLQLDPSHDYGKMDFGTRDRYRHVVERLSRASLKSEEEVAVAAIQLAQSYQDKLKSTDNNTLYSNSFVDNNAAPSVLTNLYCHVGYYLIGKGLPQLQKKLEAQSFYSKLSHLIKQWALGCYLGSIALITAGLVYAFLLKASISGVNTAWLVVLGIVIAICGSQLAVALVNLGATLLVPPKTLPRMDFAKGLPASFRTLVVVPAMLGSSSGIQALIKSLEIRFLGNRDHHLHFALLTDFNDAATEHMPNDAELLNLAAVQISALNKQYANEESDIFFLLHRPRQWNVQENVWMGRERKRGKLVDLNNFLRGNNQTAFSLIIGRTQPLSQVKYVITLDSDTQLPRESARQYVGTMVHPLNRPQLDKTKKVVVEGYGILQPRVAEVIPDEGPTRYVRLCGNEFGIDPYTRTVSDVYQDLFGEGSFIGKGIYDVDLFQQVLEQRFPDNQILSHDLLEGCYLRSGFLSDVPLYEKSPASYLADAKRRIRWIRGDWQLIGWILPWVKDKDARYGANPLSLLSKFKLLDNLRRSLVPVALLTLFGLNWTILPEFCFWIGIILAIIVLPAGINILLELLRKPIDRLPSQHLANMTQEACHRTAQLIAYLACLPYEAWYSLCAILRTCWRMMISKQHLLEWTPSDQFDSRQGDKLIHWLATMWVGPAAAFLALSILLVHNRIHCLIYATPILLLWLTSPLFARWLSQPFQRMKPKLSAMQIRFLHKMARKTWDFFDTFITAEDHWLPPDNYQETPIEALARRSSPTNMGLSLLANLTAYDFGYITLPQLLDRTSNALKTIGQLERYRGHLYNWYNTATLEPLLPRYVSTVDSGNLAGHLLTLRQGLLSLPDEPLLNQKGLEGLQDTVDVLETLLIESSSQIQLVNRFRQLIEPAKASFTGWSAAQSFSRELCEAAKQLLVFDDPSTSVSVKVSRSEIDAWANKLQLQCQAIRDELETFGSIPELPPNATLRMIANLTSTESLTTEGYRQAKDRLALIELLAAQIASLAEMDVSFLLDEASHLMTIGFNVDEQRRDLSNYDLLSSEARLGSFVAIAQGQVLQDSWFALGRLMVSNGGEPILISWSGSMFEYLMPLLVMPNYPGTLLDQTYRAAVNRQINHGKKLGVPWGVSESGYNAIDTQFNYLYRAFGVPGLGLKRGLEDDLVIAPYASAMALMVAPEAACLNLQRLEAENATGKFGFYEAIDFTVARLPRDESKRAIVRSFMAHHQGMTLLAFSYLLHNQPMQQRFIADPLFQSSLLLLQERAPKPTAIYLKIPKIPNGNAVTSRPQASMRVFNTPNTRTPQVQLLSNGNYHLVLTQAGGGYSRWKELAVTRWREDSTCDNWGLFTYIRDVMSGEFCSTNYQPTTGLAENFKAVFSEAHAEFTRTAMQLDMHTEVVVSPEDDIELRRLRIHNRSKAYRTIDFTSYAEVVLAPFASDQAQPAFNNLFVETKLLKEKQAVLATRRPRDESEVVPWLMTLLNVYGDQPYTLSFETDRAKFVGRGHTLAAPAAMLESGELSNTEGAVLDPIIAIRCRLSLAPDAIVIFDLLTGVTDTYEHCVSLVEKYGDRRLANRIFELAWTHGQVLLHQLNISEENAQLYTRLASAILYTSSSRRAEARILASNHCGQSRLWSYSISGDLPIVLLYIEDATNIELVRQLIQAHTYWRRKGLKVDLVILNEERISYRQTLQDQIMGLITANTTNEHAGTIVLRAIEQVPTEDCILFQSVARIIFSDKNGTLKEQMSRRPVSPPSMPFLNLKKLTETSQHRKLNPLSQDLQFFNGLGGFNSRGDEYIIRLTEGVSTPAPWVNVLANPQFGCLVSESGQGYTWIENAHEFRLSPWDNDPLQDSAGELFYFRDEDTGKVWSPTALPCRGEGDYHIRHGFGYSVFEHIEDGIYSELWVYVAFDAAVKFFAFKIRNLSGRQRRLSVTGYVSWVLGDLRSKNAMHVITSQSSNGVLLAQNHFNTEFGDRTAFFDATTSIFELKGRTVTGDRTEFLGRNGTAQKPAALNRKRLSGRVGAGLDPCGAIQLIFDLESEQSGDIVFTLGAGHNKQEADTLAQRHRGPNAAKSALTTVRQYWQQILKRTQVNTPDAGVNLLINGWLLYQMLSSRLWGRSGYYQSGGAFGFRDQLQDVMSLSQVAPDLFRAHLLLSAAHQFEAGDVQHWWHPPQNRGVRTRCSDDYLWLPFALCHYIETTGDITVLNEKVPFLQGRSLKEDEESYYELPMQGHDAVSLYQHAVRAILHGLKFGEHGLPLMGSGDWNDGMNLVGIQGRGESVWLGFFLYAVLKRFAPLATSQGDNDFALRCEEESKRVQQQIEMHAWDGKWYRRAYFDDGTPLGSHLNTECQIDSIAQSWSVLSKAGDPKRTQEAMESLYRHLVSTEDGLIKLLDPPFDKSKPNPGYIEGYVPGIRENGGQYTHAAIWAAMAFAELGNKELAWQLLHILNPIHHGRTPAEIHRYKIEPYVVAGDTYSVAPHTGRGGWSWYTGSAGWLYRLLTETLLGLRLEKGQQLRLIPVLPEDWEGFSIDYYFGNTLYTINVIHTTGSLDAMVLLLDDHLLEGNVIPLQDDGQIHHVQVKF